MKLIKKNKNKNFIFKFIQKYRNKLLKNYVFFLKTRIKKIIHLIDI